MIDALIAGRLYARVKASENSGRRAALEGVGALDNCRHSITVAVRPPEV